LPSPRCAGCVASWTLQENTNVQNGLLYASANNATECATECFNDARCTGVDFVPANPVGRNCWLSGPWSGATNVGGARGVDHYSLARHCAGKCSYSKVSKTTV